jgi:hypothetical protein
VRYECCDQHTKSFVRYFMHRRVDGWDGEIHAGSYLPFDD